MSLIELTGPSGAGKSHFAARLRAPAEAAGLRFLPRAGTGGSPGLANLRQEWSLAPMFGRAFLRRLDLWSHVFVCLRRYADSPYYSARAARGVWRQLARRERLMREADPELPLIVDEFTVHAAHYVFSHAGRAPRPDDVEKFLTLIPLPDVLICLTSDEDTLVNRMQTRDRRPRSGLTAEATRSYVRHARLVSSLIRDSEAVAGRSHVVTADSNMSDAALLDFIQRVQRLVTPAPRS